MIFYAGPRFLTLAARRARVRSTGVMDVTQRGRRKGTEVKRADSRDDRPSYTHDRLIIDTHRGPVGRLTNPQIYYWVVMRVWWSIITTIGSFDLGPPPTAPLGHLHNACGPYAGPAGRHSQKSWPCTKNLVMVNACNRGCLRIRPAYHMELTYS